jgi:hypothetical protein
MRAEDLDVVLSKLLELDPARNFDLELCEPVPWEGASDLTTDEVDRLLQEGQHQGLLGGERREGAGSTCWWSQVRLTVGGLRRLGQWPPVGGEHLPGPWEDGLWATVDRRVLSELATSPPHHGMLFAPVFGDGIDQWKRWRAAERLLSADLIDGECQQGGLALVRVTLAGHRALAGPTAPIDRAVAELRRGAKVEAMTACVEEALADLLRGLAGKAGIPTEDKGRPVRLGNLADQLKSQGAFGSGVHAEIGVCLALRNETNHGGGAEVWETQIERVIGMVRDLQGRFAPAECVPPQVSG